LTEIWKDNPEEPMGNISNISNIDQRSYISGTTETRKADVRDGQPTEKKSDITQSDKVSLSKEARDIQLAEEAVAAEPDIRTEKVNPIKQKIVEGTYEVNAEKVAESLIGTNVSEVV